MNNRYRRTERGAISILLLAGIMILSLLVFTIIDTGTASRDKMEVQNAADMAAISQASTKARAMNMMAYANVAKRSIHSINASYMASMAAYAQWASFLHGIGGVAEQFDINADIKSKARANATVWQGELIDDFELFTGCGVELMQAGEDEAEAYGNGTKPAKLMIDSSEFLAQIVETFVTAFWDFIIGNSSIQDMVTTIIQELWGHTRARSITIPKMMGRDIVDGAYTGGSFESGGNDDLHPDTSGSWSDPPESVDGNGIRDFNVEGSSDNQYSGLAPRNSNPDSCWKDGMLANKFGSDLRAFSNYQRYFAGVTPWWAWTEQLIKAIRNGATTSGSFPRPLDMELPSTSDIAAAIAKNVGVRLHLDNTLVHDRLPVRPGIGNKSKHENQYKLFDRGRQENIDYNQMHKVLANQLPRPFTLNKLINIIGDIIGGKNVGDAIIDRMVSGRFSAAATLEHLANVVLASLPTSMQGRTTYGSSAEEASWWKAGVALMTLITSHNIVVRQGTDAEPAMNALQLVQAVYNNTVGPDVANPWVMRRYRFEADWLKETSNIVMAYKKDKRGRFDEQEGKYSLVDMWKPAHQGQKYGGNQFGWIGSAIGGTIYTASGYWAIARSEITFQKQGADPGTWLWKPGWSARMRPVALPNELPRSEYTMSKAFHDVLPSIAITSLIGVRSFEDLGEVAIDITQMERDMSAMGPTTGGGVAK